MASGGKKTKKDEENDLLNGLVVLGTGAAMIAGYAAYKFLSAPQEEKPKRLPVGERPRRDPFRGRNKRSVSSSDRLHKDRVYTPSWEMPADSDEEEEDQKRIPEYVTCGCRVSSSPYLSLHDKLQDNYEDHSYITSTWKMPDSDKEEDRERPRNDPLGAIRYGSRISSSLHDKLQDYYEDHVDIPSWKMEEAKEVVDVVKKHFRDYVMKLCKAVEFWDTGSTTEGLKVIKPDEFDVMVVMDAMESFMRNGYGYEKKEPTNLSDAAGFYMIRRKSLIQFESFNPAKKWLDPGSKCIVGEFLSPEKVRRSFKSMMDQAFSNFNQYQVQPCKVQGPSVMLKVTYALRGQRKSLSIDFVPAYKFDDTVVVAKPHPKYFSKSPVSKRYEHLWRVSYSMEEKDEVTNVAAQRGCKLQCLKILKAVRVYHPAPLGMLSSYILKTIWLHMVEENQGIWEEEDLSEYFIDLVKRLEKYLRCGHLEHYFDPRVNVLGHLSESACRHALNYLSKQLHEKTFKNLLKVPVK